MTWQAICGMDMMRFCIAAVAFGSLYLVSTEALADKSYYIDEHTSYSTLPIQCRAGDVNVITASLQTQLSSDGWTGSRYTGASAWPQDFVESCSSTYGTGGVDSTYADNRSLAVFAGHGSVNRLWFGIERNSTCSVSMTNNARLGAMAGAKASFGMWLACDVLQGSLMGTQQYQWLRQQAGFENSIGISTNEPRDFYNATNSSTNADAWLNRMGNGGRTAIIATTETRNDGNTSDACWSVHNSAKLKGNIFNTPRGGGPACGGAQAWYWYCYQTRR